MTKTRTEAVTVESVVVPYWMDSFFESKVRMVLAVVAVMAVHGVAYGFVATTWLAPFISGFMK